MVQGDAAGGTQLGVAYVDVEARLEEAKKQLAGFEKDTLDAMKAIAESSGVALKNVEGIGGAADSAAEKMSELGMEADASWERVGDNVSSASGKIKEASENASRFGEQVAFSAATAGEGVRELDERLEGIRGRLKDIDAEATASMERVRASAGEAAAADVREVGAAADDSGVSLLALANIGAFFHKVWRKGLVGAIRDFARLGTRVIAVATNLTTLTRVAVGALRVLSGVALIGLAFEAVRLAIDGVAGGIDIARNVGRQWSNAMSADAATARRGIEGINAELERIPLLGKAVGGQMKIVMGAIRRDSELVGEGFAQWGESLREFPVLGFLVTRPLDRMLQSVTGIGRELAEARDRLIEMQREQRLQAEVAERASQSIRASQADEMTMARELALARVQGIERVREVEAQHTEQLRRDHQARLDQIEAERQVMLAPLEARREITERVEARLISSSQGLEQLEDAGIGGGLISRSDHSAAREEITQLFDAQKDTLRRSMGELTELREQLSAEAIGREQDSRFNQLRSLYSELEETRMRLEGDTFAAQAEAIRRNFAQRIIQAEREGDRQRVAMLAALRDERIRQVEADEAAVAEARTRSAREQGQRIADDLRSVERDIQRAMLGDDDAALEAFNIGAEFGDRIKAATDRLQELRSEIDELREAGPSDAEKDRLALLAQQAEMLEHQRDRLGQLKEMRLAGIELDGGIGGGMTGQLAREIGRDRITRGEGLTEVQDVRDKQGEQQRAAMIQHLRDIADQPGFS